MAVTSVRPVTWTGAELKFVVPFPSCPRSFVPHDQTVLSRRSAREWPAPAATAVLSLRSAICLGDFSPLPQAQTAPALVNASVWADPQETALMSPTLFTWAGAVPVLVEPSPSCPWSLAPQAQTVPSFFTRAT